MERLKLPPYGWVISAYQQESIKLEFLLYIFVGKDAASEARQHKKMGILCTYLPFNEDFITFYWPIKHQKVIVYDTGGCTVLHLKKFCLNLLSFNPKTILLFSDSCPMEFFNGEGYER